MRYALSAAVAVTLMEITMLVLLRTPLVIVALAVFSLWCASASGWLLARGRR